MMECWTGKNPVDPPTTKSPLPQTKRIARGREEALLTYTPAASGDGAELLVQQFREGEPAGSLRLTRRDGVTIGQDAEGRTPFTARTRADGRVEVHNQSPGTASLFQPSADRKRETVPQFF